MIPNFGFIRSKFHHPHRQLLALLCSIPLILVTACNQNTATSTVPVSHAVAVTPKLPQPITFYEGPDELEPFTPFFINTGSSGSVVTVGFAQAEGAYYLTSYDTNSWKQNNLSNGFSPTDPLWECDSYIDTSLAVAADTSALSRSCIDGSVTIFKIPDALPVYHVSATQTLTTLGQRAPIVAFSRTNHMVAITNDGPSGPGTTISLVDSTTWQPINTTITIATGLLSRPDWSADGTRLAAISTDGVLHVWSANTGTEIAHQSLTGFAIGSTASDVASPAPQWSPDGTKIYTSSPSSAGTNVTAFSFAGSTLVQTAQVTIAFPLSKVNPQLSPDGSALFLHSGMKHGQIFTTPALKQVSDFDLPAELALWSSNAKQIAVFTLNATVVPLTIGNLG